MLTAQLSIDDKAYNKKKSCRISNVSWSSESVTFFTNIHFDPVFCMAFYSHLVFTSCMTAKGTKVPKWNRIRGAFMCFVFMFQLFYNHTAPALTVTHTFPACSFSSFTTSAVSETDTWQKVTRDENSVLKYLWTPVACPIIGLDLNKHTNTKDGMQRFRLCKKVTSNSFTFCLNEPNFPNIF